MKKRESDLTGWNIMKWAALFLLVFAMSMPVSAKLCKAAGNTYSVSVSSGYLALRTQKSYNSSNEIGQLYNGDTVTVSDYGDSTYWYVYSPKYNQYGYVNCKYLVATGSAPAVSGNICTVSVSKGYLALRSDASYNPANEIGELYSGDTVEVQSSTGAYWYVYSYKLGIYGYVDKDYLVSGGTASTSDTRTVTVSKGYLALRSAKKYDDANEIGQLYNGDTVQVMDTSDATYWYVYSSKLGKNGYVNKDYLSGGYSSTVATKTVSVRKGYLALRSAKSYNDANEIGQLYNGDTVQIVDTSDATYWYVYAPSLGKNGYVNCKYLY